MASTRKPIAIFPDLPGEDAAVEKDGRVTSGWSFFFQHLVMALQTNLKPEGFVLPPLSAANIALLTGDGSAHNILYDSTNNAFNGNVEAGGAQVWIPFAMITNYAGDPNGNVAGSLYWFCWDTSGMALYICTTAGDAAGAAWTAV